MKGTDLREGPVRLRLAAQVTVPKLEACTDLYRVGTGESGCAGNHCSQPLRGSLEILSIIGFVANREQRHFCTSEVPPDRPGSVPSPTAPFPCVREGWRMVGQLLIHVPSAEGQISREPNSEAPYALVTCPRTVDTGTIETATSASSPPRLHK